MLVCTSRFSHNSSHTDPELFEMKAIVTGNVHGVGFRAETKFLASRLHLNGYVKNCEKGSVEIIAQGSKENLEALVTSLKNSFKNHLIEDFKFEFYKPRSQYSGFSIRVNRPLA